ncbi:unnamed protein product [Thlaspi arvense]|uniref:Leucine-rich repeat-containing N-terminal plant-type domain-containing protein n=1 Tax=Thlaspi arvense TaxID=13288 RepID=A0AAU9SK03_THLAR|nr:unnamed protein product [Thlaspi arvense]
MKRLFLLLSFSALILLEAYGFTDETDRQALLEFKSQVSEDKRVVLSSWNHSFPLCNWKGVTCGRKHKRVTRVDLGGVISPSVGNLSFLISLDLSNNSFGGTIPQEVQNLFRLENLDLELNFLGGRIPVGLFNCSRLLNLYLNLNSLGESVPSDIGLLTKLVSLDLAGNNLKGKLPSSLGNLTSLRDMGFNDNNLEGGLPDDIARMTKMVRLIIYENNLSGDFPPAIYNLSSLELLNIFGNRFSGSLRHDFGNSLPNFRELYMENNHLTGEIPTTLCNISNLQMLKMGQNHLTGSIPTSFGRVGSLQSLLLHDNSLGSYSAGDLEFLSGLTNCTKLDTLLVYHNRLGGDLPISITNLSTKLITLQLGGNYISGMIPHGIGNLINPQTLRKDTIFCGQHHSIGYNKLNGTIPPEIMQLSLLTLSMPHNLLTGTLPKEVGGLEHLVTLSVEHNKLSSKEDCDRDEWILHDDLIVGFPLAECLTLVLDVGLRCSEEYPTNRLATSEATKELVSIRKRFFKASRTTRGIVHGEPRHNLPLKWTMTELINHQDILTKIRDEIESVLGATRRLIKESDLQKLPYLQAAIKETLRLHPVGPLLRRESNRDIKINGYDVKSGTKIFVNAYGIMRDPTTYKDPDKFIPERLLVVEENAERKMSYRYQRYMLELKGQDMNHTAFGSELYFHPFSQNK